MFYIEHKEKVCHIVNDITFFSVQLQPYIQLRILSLERIISNRVVHIPCIYVLLCLMQSKVYSSNHVII